MASVPVAWREQAPVISPDERVYEFGAQGEVGAIGSHNSPLQDKKAPSAEPEEDKDILEPGAQDKTKESMFSPSSLSTEECFETEDSSSLEAEVAEWISNGEIISDPTEELKSSDIQNFQERSQTPPLTETFDREVDSTPEDMTADNMRKEENITQLNFTPDDNHSEPENNMSGAAAEIHSMHHSPSERDNSDNEHTVCSPPFADESEEEEGVSSDMMSCQQQCSKLHMRSKSSQLSYSANISISTERTSTLPAVPSAKQQNELLTQSQCERAPRGANQEATQQVLSQGSPPLSSVAMELSNQGGAASQGSGCGVVRERHSRAGEITEGESKRTGGEDRQKEGGPERNKAVEQQNDEGLLRFSKTDQTQELKGEKCRFVLSKHSRMESDSCDDSQSDSGVSADFSPCNTMEGNTTISPDTPSAAHKETPIEREIQRAIEREHSLRRSRGLPNRPALPEYVDIPLRKSVLCQSVAAKSERCQGTGRQFAGKKMQHEIQEEVQREQDLVKLGKVPGFYDKGTVRQLKERKQLFEAFQTPSESNMTVSTSSKAVSWSSTRDMGVVKDPSLHASTIGGSHGPDSLKEGGFNSLTPRGPGFVEGAGCQVIILENNLSVPAGKLYHGKSEAKPVTAVRYGSPNISLSRRGGHDAIKGKEQEQEDVEAQEAPKEYPFFKLRSSTNIVQVEQDIQEAKERERELQKQRIILYGTKEGSKGGELLVGRPAGIEEKSPMSTSSLNGQAVPGSSSRGVTGPPAASQSAGKLGRWPPVQAEEEKINRPEVLRSPRTPRQKTPLVKRWESGLVNGHNEEDN